MVYSKIENGEITTAKELLLEICPSYGVKFVNGVVQYGEPITHHKEQLDKTVKEYLAFQGKTDEENIKCINETFKKINLEKEKSISYYANKIMRYGNMIEQLKLWKHTKTWDNMYNRIMEDLVKEYKFAEIMIDDYKNQDYKKETLEEFKTRQTEYYLKQIKRYSDGYAEDIEYTENNNKIIKEFEDSLKEME